MKIAVIGGGTAGYIAAAHITKHFPHFELYHIYDPTIPTIGVGEGAIPGLVLWLGQITGLNQDDLETTLKTKCQMTYKWGIKFENWGIEYKQFMHHFHPIGLTHAYHFSAANLIELLKEYTSAIHIDKKVINLSSNSITSKITFADNTILEVDIAIDARGFPQSINEEQYERLSLIPTNAAVIRQGPTVNEGVVDFNIGSETLMYQSVTRSIARPYGWIFVIPLTNRNSYGYIFNNLINSVQEVKTDFDEFMKSENILFSGQERYLQFPCFCCRTQFDGSIFKIGNSAGFIEPLEATAIGIILKQVVSFSSWLLQVISQTGYKGRLKEEDLKIFNKYLLNILQRISLFVGWHYSQGSRFDTVFWRFAKQNFNDEYKKLENQEILEEFQGFVDDAYEVTHPLKNYLEFSNFDYQLTFQKKIFFEQWNCLSFAEVGFGIGHLS